MTTGVVSMVDQISAAVVQRLADASYPPLVAGKILLGEQHLNENDSPPKIVFIPSSTSYGSKDITSSIPLLEATPLTAEQLIEISNRPVLTESLMFRVQCWGRTSTETDPVKIPDDDYNFTRNLAHAVIAACDDLARGAFEVGPGDWAPNGLMVYGRIFEFSITFATPVLSVLLPFVPPGTVGQVTMAQHVPGVTPDELVTVIELSGNGNVQVYIGSGIVQVDLDTGIVQIQY